MAKVKLVFQGFLTLVLLIGVYTAPQHAQAQMPESTLNSFAQPKAVNTYWQADKAIPDSFELVAENPLFKLYGNKTTLAFKVVDKRSGYIWSSNLDERAEDDRLNVAWTAFAQSGISIEYLDQKAVNRRISITNSDVVLDVEPIDQGFKGTVTFTDYAITLGVIVRLEANGVSVEIPFETIQQENPDYKLGLVYVFPFLGATRGDSIPGYMFIPDGLGSLIRFDNSTKAENMFYGRYYGADLGMISSLPYDPFVNRPYNLTIPVFGMVHGIKQNAFISIVEKGAAYGELQVHPAGIITNFNFLYNAFIYNESFFQATNRAGAGVTTIQRDTNAFDVKIHFRFLTKDDSDYVGMAQSYQQYLVDKGNLKKIPDQNNDIGIRLEFLGGDKEEVLLWHRLNSMTTVSQMADILKALDIHNTDVIYYGWQPGGASSMPPRSLRLDRKLGNLEQLRALIERISADGGNFYLYLDPQAALWGESGYSPRNDLAISITNKNLVGYNRNQANYFLNYDALREHLTAICQDVSSKLAAGLALDGIGSILYSDFKNNHFLNREEAIQQYQNLVLGSGVPTSFYRPNNYMFGAMTAYYDMPLTNNGYIYTTQAVPFLAIVLAGYVPYYGPALNFSSNLQEDVLKMVDYGVYPSFFLTHEVTANILNTRSNWIYTSSFEQWGLKIKQTYQWMNTLLGPVKGQEIVARDVLADGVVATTYANGKQIIVNYNDTPFSAGRLLVDGKDAIIREVIP